ncbi:MAG: PQQ-binding-like beta-propeller repeat protein [Planctomycetes bacterium]|nr:PQQ-binding-like beta-propeller repeat protein [Planctomycetota bacterium]
MTASSSLSSTLRGLADDGREGTLTVREGDQRVTLYVARTGIRLVSSGPRRGVRIGEVLLKAGKISQRQMDLVLERQQKSNLRFGELLYLMCQITEDEIRQAVRTRIQEEILDLYLLEGASMDFLEGPPPQDLFETDGPKLEHPFPIPPIIEEGDRRRADWELFRVKLPPRETALSKAPPNPGKSELPLDDRTLQMIELCDGRRGTEQVVEASPKFRFDTLKALAYLISVGRVAVGGRVVAGATPTEMLKQPFLGTGPEAAVAAPGFNPESAPAPAARSAPASPTRFGLDSVPEVDWEEEKRTSRTPASKGDTSKQATPRPPKQLDVPTFELRADPNPPSAPPPGYLRKEETSRLMARNAAQAVAHRPPPLPPPEPRRRSKARYGWAAAVILLLLLGGAAAWEFTARSKFHEVDSRARTAPAAEARAMYEEFAKSWPWSSPAQAAHRAAEDLAGGRADAEAAKALRSYLASHLELGQGMTLEEEERACEAALQWADTHREPALTEKILSRKAALAAYRRDAGAALAAYRGALKDGKVPEARAAAGRLRAEFARAPEAAQAAVAVRIETSPPGGTLEANGSPARPTPRLVEVPFGAALALRATLEGHEPVSLVVPTPLPESVVVALPRSPRWSARVSGAVQVAPAVTATAVIVIPTDGTMVALAVADGHALWRARGASHPWVTPPVAARGAALVGSADGSVWSMDVSEGSVLWRVSAGSGLRGTIAVSTDGAAVLAAPTEGGVVALETSTGRVLGRADLAAPLALGPYASGEAGWAAVLEDGTVAGGPAGRGAWTAKLPSTAVAAAPSHAGLLCSCTDGTIVLVAPDGAIRWTAPNPGVAPAGVAVSPDRGVALLSKRHLACYDLASGKVLWLADLPADASAPPVLGDVLALVPCDDGSVRALDAATGADRWTFRAGQKVRAAAAMGREGAAIVGGNGDVWFVP